MILSTADFARAWRSVLIASSGDKKIPQLYRTILIEEFDTGVQLVSTDGRMLLLGWVPRDDDAWTNPQLDEAPRKTVVAMDVDHRANNLCAFILSLCARADKDDLGSYPELRLETGVTDVVSHGGLPGMDPTWVTLSVPDTEMVKLAVYDGHFPSWRKVVSAFQGEMSSVIGFDADTLARLAKLGKMHAGSTVTWEFGGEQRASALAVRDSEPHISGIVLPVQWDFEANAPYVAPPDEDDEPVTEQGSLDTDDDDDSW